MKMNKTAYEIYKYIENAFYSKAPIDVVFRLNHGTKGVVEDILNWIWYNYIEENEDV